MGPGPRGGSIGGARREHLFLTGLRDVPAREAGQSLQQMTDRVLILALVAGASGVLLAVYSLYRRRWTPAPERLGLAELGLEMMPGCCAFVVFTTPACQPCKSAVKIVTDVATESRSRTEVVAVDAMSEPDLALRYEVRTIPTVFLITASGHVVHRWRNVPDPVEAREKLDAL